MSVSRYRDRHSEARRKSDAGDAFVLANILRTDPDAHRPLPHEGRQIPIMVGGNSDAALRRAAAWGDGWYGFNLAGMADVADRLAYLDARCRDSGRDPTVLRRAVALRQPRDGDVAALTDLGVNELVIVESPPADPRRAAGWVSSLADRWLPTETSPA